MNGRNFEASIETQIQRIVAELEASGRGTKLTREEHCRLLWEFERLVEEKVKRQD